MPSRGYARDKFHNCTCDKRPHGHGFRLRNFAADMRNITEIIVHCTATPRSRNVSVAEIDSWHRQRGFNQIGYHYVVALDGTVHRAATRVLPERTASDTTPEASEWPM